ncbi:MAG: orotidine 5'-phosphate decarboxylase / HUMPS family protein [Candidatus Nanoarchaeia archaeon]|nr:orotidine 5'-phosphate decarboxylase [Candidatus Haiyanarchaeum thermophilum]MCW1302818.1 orotidine 5'-phosphate decarboxylase [Candidatus Haiyanarchaeum thermophilum]MCW1303499.1 orotidine 5'-phosphate decarboxylase [Candidatus Haiyanarchaeum thermophilum]MCW1306679.1 orotidine 5'-phosphate decarboxylase [Candidatus Haiyanarchaeum thermophilum]MCW1307365.1 orotidine 5'-phosphate decarboxylase [Candidatus Haiyanarchaeum thermophilum]
MPFIKYERSVIPACDVEDLKHFEQLVQQTCDVEGIGAYKVGAILTIRYGLPRLVEIVRKFTDLPVIYDHQKGMTDIHELGQPFARAVKEAGANAIIGFPQAGPATQEAWIKACKEMGLEVIIGGEMTHPQYKASEGGYIRDDALDEIYVRAAKLGIKDFVVPGNKADRVQHYRALLFPLVGEELTFYAPGFILQGGRISEVAKVAGGRWHAIVGRAIYGAPSMREAAKQMTRELRSWE